MKKYFILIFVCSTTILSLPSCSSDPSFPADQVKQMDAVVTVAMSTYNIPGVIAAVWIPGKGTWIKGFGLANKSTGEAMDPSMLFRIGSLTKSFTATVILQLVDEGKLSLDDTLDKYITDPIIPNASNITVRQVANMSSGLFNYTEDTTFLLAVKANPNRVWAPEELINYSIAHAPYFAPGTNFYYSNTNYVLLSMVIKKITGNSVGSEMQSRIISPLGLSNTSFPTTSAMPSGSCHGYSLSDDGTSIVEADALDPSVTLGAGANISDIYNLKTWVETVAKGALVSDASHTAQLTCINEPDSTTDKYCFGIMKVDNFIGHDGVINGYNSMMAYLPSNGAVIIVMENLNPTTKFDVAKDIFMGVAKVALPNDVSW